MSETADPLSQIQRDIGRFVLHCGELEYIAFAAIFELEPEAETARNIAEQEFQRRVVSLLDLSREHVTGADRQEWLELWQRVCSLTQERQQIVHNPLMFGVWVNDEGDAKIDAGEIHVFRKRRQQYKPVTPASISQAAEKARSYSAEAFRLWASVFPGASLAERL
jgi:hypothetical protein